MRLAAILAFALVAAPAFAQQAPPRTLPPPGEMWIVDPDKAPPEGFYRNIPNAYDLLLRPTARYASTLAWGCVPPNADLEGEAARAADEAYKSCLDALEKQLKRLRPPTAPARPKE